MCIILCEQALLLCMLLVAFFWCLNTFTSPVCKLSTHSDWLASAVHFSIVLVGIEHHDTIAFLKSNQLTYRVIPTIGIEHKNLHCFLGENPELN